MSGGLSREVKAEIAYTEYALGNYFGEIASHLGVPPLEAMKMIKAHAIAAKLRWPISPAERLEVRRQSSHSCFPNWYVRKLMRAA